MNIIIKEIAWRVEASAHLVTSLCLKTSPLNLKLGLFSYCLEARIMVATKMPKAIIKDNTSKVSIVSPPIRNGLISQQPAIS